MLGVDLRMSCVPGERLSAASLTLRGLSNAKIISVRRHTWILKDILLWFHERILELYNIHLTGLAEGNRAAPECLTKCIAS